jgi:hypothetical protein
VAGEITWCGAAAGVAALAVGVDVAVTSRGGRHPVVGDRAVTSSICIGALRCRPDRDRAMLVSV